MERPRINEAWDRLRSGDWRDKSTWGPLLGGGALALMGLGRRARFGMPLAAAGLALLYFGAKKRGITPWGSATRPVELIGAVTVHRTPDEVYGYWRNFSNLPIFMRHLRSVDAIGDHRYHWVAEAPLVSFPIEWDTEVIEDRANELIRWRSLPESRIFSAGVVAFRSAGERGTELHVALEYRPESGVAAVVARFFDRLTADTLKQELYRFKQLMEAGEVPTAGEGRPGG